MFDKTRFLMQCQFIWLRYHTFPKAMSIYLATLSVKLPLGLSCLYVRPGFKI